MKIKRKSRLAGIVAAIVVVSVTTVFATSAAEEREIPETIEKTGAKTANNIVKAEERIAMEDSFTEREYEKLLDLQFEDYEDMRISEFRDQVWMMTDTAEYNDLLERFFEDENLYLQYENKAGTDSSEISSFLYGVLSPLLLEDWHPSFNGCAATDFPDESDNVIFEYAVTLDILDADALTVREYNRAREGVMENLGNLLEDRTVSELQDREQMRLFLDSAVEDITSSYENENLKIDVEYSYMPMVSDLFNDSSMDISSTNKDLPEEYFAESSFVESSVMSVSFVSDLIAACLQRVQEWDRIMAPYTPYGLTYHYDQKTDDFKMYYRGKEVRGIYDGGAGCYIAEHIGTGEEIYDKNVTELIAVYKGGALAGLREATAQEMKANNERRHAAADYGRIEQGNVQEVRRFLPATKEDYQSLFALKTSNYRSKSIADFDSGLLDWANENYERMERIGCDREYKDYRVTLTDAEMTFVSLTTWLSGMENGAYVRSIQKGEPERDVRVDVGLPDRADSSGYAWCSLWYSFSYHIPDKEKVSVGRRDDQIGGMMEEIQDYWESTKLDQLLQMTESDMLKLLQSFAEKYSSQDVTITVDDDQVSFEGMDERVLHHGQE